MPKRAKKSVPAFDAYETAHGIQGASFDQMEAELTGPFAALLAWNELEAIDNHGPNAAFKLLELCKLPTRDFKVKAMLPISVEQMSEQQI